LSPSEFRALGIDLGDVRIGLAVSDPLGCIAQPLESLQRVGPRKDLHRVAQRVRDLEVTLVVIGLPLLLSGEEGEQAGKVREFTAGLERHLRGVPIEYWDERLTTAEAERTMISGGVSRRRRKSAVDSVAAALILQGYLDARSGSVG
jgi:putative Holliday junction resolvase